MQFESNRQYLRVTLGNHDRSVSFRIIEFPAWKQFVQNEERGIYEPEVVHAFMRFVREGDFVIDCGANIGYHTLIAWKLVGERGVVAAFEASKATFGMLRDNLAGNKTENVTSLPIVLWNEDGEVDFYEHDVGCGYSSVLAGAGGGTPKSVSARSLDSLFAIAIPRLIKIDCEGSEERILRGAGKMLRRGVGAVIVELNSNLLPLAKSSEASIREYMASLGYDCFLLQRTGVRPIRLLPAQSLGADERLDPPTMINVLFSTEERVREVW
jgi:FkbM family methyltransferase